jgi:hypothetical protein
MDSMLLGFLAIDQYGNTVKLTGVTKHPRKALMEKVGAQSARKMYCDTADGTPRHIGYILGRSWYTLYEVHAWAGKS